MKRKHKVVEEKQKKGLEKETKNAEEELELKSVHKKKSEKFITGSPEETLI